MNPSIDGVTGQELNPKLVLEGKKTELEKVKSRGVYACVKRKDAVKDLDGKCIKTRWVLTQKGYEVEGRSRLVAQEFAQ